MVKIYFCDVSVITSELYYIQIDWISGSGLTIYQLLSNEYPEGRAVSALENIPNSIGFRTRGTFLKNSVFTAKGVIFLPSNDFNCVETYSQSHSHGYVPIGNSSIMIIKPNENITLCGMDVVGRFFNFSLPITMTFVFYESESYNSNSTFNL